MSGGPGGNDNDQAEDRDHEEDEEEEVTGVLPMLPVDAGAGAEIPLDGEKAERSGVMLNGFQVEGPFAKVIIGQEAVRRQ